MNSKKFGAIGIAKAIDYFTSKEYSVFVPVSDVDKYDLIVDVDGRLYKIQCKTCSKLTKHATFEISLRTFGGYKIKSIFTKYIKGDFDLLFIYCVNGTSYLIPFAEIEGKSSVTVGGNSYKEYELG